MLSAATRSFTILTLVCLAACNGRNPIEPSPVQPRSTAERTYVVLDPQTLGQYLSITAGSYHTCVRQGNGDVYCWGQNDEAQIGTGVNDSPYSCPGCVIAPTFIMNATEVSAALVGTCALSSTPIPAGYTNAFCWGNGHASVPQRMPGGVQFRHISEGYRSACGTASTGILCWGFTPPNPALLWNGSFSQVALGSGYGCAIDVAGGSFVDCWGVNTSGQTAMDPTQFPSPQTLLRAPFASGVSHVATGGNFTCIDLSTGLVNCFGANDQGQLGDGTSAGAWTYLAQTVSIFGCSGLVGCHGIPTWLHLVTAGTAHACALDPNGAAYCWGANNFGQLGNGTTSNSAYAVPVAGGHTFRAIAAGARHTCAIGTDNVIYCWGDDFFGQLGTGAPLTSSLTPIPTAAFRAQVPTS